MVWDNLDIVWEARCLIRNPINLNCRITSVQFLRNIFPIVAKASSKIIDNDYLIWMNINASAQNHPQLHQKGYKTIDDSLYNSCTYMHKRLIFNPLFSFCHLAITLHKYDTNIYIASLHYIAGYLFLINIMKKCW